MARAALQLDETGVNGSSFHAQTGQFRHDERGSRPVQIPPRAPVRPFGVLDMVRAIASDRPHVASGELGHHVVDVLLSAQESAASEQFVKVASTVAAVPLLPDDFDPFASTLVATASTQRAPHHAWLPREAVLRSALQSRVSIVQVQMR